ncbi:hypothetical protein BK004_02225 [bacterium CG10_46_32]|nr:MAG: hypothetical protein BK004_02225 [bacterium CG10_46_32]
MVNINIASAVIIEVTNGRGAGVHASSQLCSVSSPDIFRKVINVIFALPKGNVQHKFSLWRTLEPKRWKLEVFDFSCVQHIHDLTAINRISGETIRVPT